MLPVSLTAPAMSGNTDFPSYIGCMHDLNAMSVTTPNVSCTQVPKKGSLKCLACGNGYTGVQADYNGDGRTHRHVYHFMQSRAALL